MLTAFPSELIPRAKSGSQPWLLVPPLLARTRSLVARALTDTQTQTQPNTPHTHPPP